MNTDRRIIVFVPVIDAFGGVERLIVELSRFLHREGRPHTILCLRRSIELTNHADWPLDVQSLNPPRNAAAESWALSRYFRAFTDVEILAPLFFDLKGAFYAGLFRCPDFHLHLTDPPSLLPLDVSKHAPSLRNRFMTNEAANDSWRTKLRGEAVHRINKRGVQRARSVITMTNANANEIEALYDRRPIVVRQGVALPPSAFQKISPATKNVVFLSVSRLERNKRIDWILNALAELEHAAQPLSTQFEWILDVVGDGSDAALLRRLAVNLGIAGRVKFHGHISDDQLEEMFAQASIFLMPAVQGYGLPALEALARDIPVVLHRQSGVSEIFDQTPWVQCIADGKEDLAQAIKMMIGNIASGTLQRVSKPLFPTASDWAQQIAAICGWL